MATAKIGNVLKLSTEKHEDLGDILILTVEDGGAALFDVETESNDDGDERVSGLSLRIKKATALKLAKALEKMAK